MLVSNSGIENVLRCVAERGEAELVEAARRGDVVSFGALYRRYYAAAVGVACSVLGDSHLAEDAVQEAFAIAWRDIDRLRRPDRFVAWLGGICRNVARKMGKSRLKRIDLQSLAAPIGEPSDHGLGAAVRRSIERLPRSGREVVLLRYFSGLSYQQIAKALDVSTAAVRGRLTRAKRKIANDLRRLGLGRTT